MKSAAVSPPIKCIERLIKEKASRETFYHRKQKFNTLAGPLWQKALAFQRLNGVPSS